MEEATISGLAFGFQSWREIDRVDRRVGVRLCYLWRPWRRFYLL